MNNTESTEYIKFRQRVKAKKSKNLKFVKIRADRKCSTCGRTIAVGSEALTVNKKEIGREWICIECVIGKINNPIKYLSDGDRLVIEIQKARLQKSMLGFTDEGGCMAYDDYIDNLQCQLQSLIDSGKYKLKDKKILYDIDETEY